MELSFTVYEFTELDIAIADLSSCIAAAPFLKGVVEDLLFNEDGSMKEGLLSLRARDDGGAFGIAIEVSDRLKQIVSAVNSLAGMPEKLTGAKPLDIAKAREAASVVAAGLNQIIQKGRHPA